MARLICDIAQDILDLWRKPYFGAVPYLDAMLSLTTKESRFGCDDAEYVVNYFLANAQTFRGPDAKRLKQELKDAIKGN